ncbi:Uncharacterized protein BM_BM13351 [Brugia malayi]|uniref:Bm13351 n=2 Tax=Brugia TaxID=6278 RepID=A0A0K0IXK2_BRUMA|nr:Uncharacterized protein BM_BM13351 [Brugia malayi]CDQ05954.1 Bm13351 [Brugia malayi]VDO28081.1 unnamed protein product [Brugia timori]VIO88491.1 Uncharacterized protein BM_BM13351 [Brugia malayi]
MFQVWILQPDRSRFSNFVSLPICYFQYSEIHSGTMKWMRSDYLVRNRKTDLIPVLQVIK